MSGTAVDHSCDIYITANSPGEIAGWVVPVVREIRTRIWKCRITLVIVPCQYASGAELSYGSQTGVDRCIRMGDVTQTISARSAAESRLQTLVLHLGGDFFFSTYIAKKLKAPLWAYASRPRRVRRVERFFLPDLGAERRFALMDVPKEKYERIGNLALDSVVLKESEEETRTFLGLRPDEPVITYLLGSRPIEYSEGIPFFMKIAPAVAERFPDHRVFFPLAPTVEEGTLQRGLKLAGVKWMGETRVHAIDLGGGRWAGVVRDRTLEILNCSRLAIAVPGTNNLQAAALYIPYIMVLPMDRADEFPLDGLPGVLPLWIPGVRRFKKALILRLNARTPFVSLPNKMAGKMIAPEIRGIFQPEEVVEKAAELLSSPDKLQWISRAFWELTHERGASIRLAERIAEWKNGTKR